jgi:hypothetical protein
MRSGDDVCSARIKYESSISQCDSYSCVDQIFESRDHVENSKAGIWELRRGLSIGDFGARINLTSSVRRLLCNTQLPCMRWISSQLGPVTVTFGIRLGWLVMKYIF